MGEIAHLHPGPFNNTAIVIDQRVDLGGQGRNFTRETSLQGFGLAGPDLFQ